MAISLAGALMSRAYTSMIQESGRAEVGGDARVDAVSAMTS